MTAPARIIKISGRHGYRALNTLPSTTIIHMLDYTSLYFVCYLSHLLKRALSIKTDSQKELHAHTNHTTSTIAILCLHTALPPCASKLIKLQGLACFPSNSSACRPTYWLDLIHTMSRQIRTSQVHLRQLPPHALSMTSHSSTHHNRAHRPRTAQHLQPTTWSWEI